MPPDSDQTQKHGKDIVLSFILLTCVFDRDNNAYTTISQLNILKLIFKMVEDICLLFFGGKVIIDLIRSISTAVVFPPLSTMLMI